MICHQQRTSKAQLEAYEQSNVDKDGEVESANAVGNPRRAYPEFYFSYASSSYDMAA
jgi:hypothetical protein